MTGAEQKERHKVYEKIQKQLDELSIEIHNAWEVEVEARQKCDTSLHDMIVKEIGRVESLTARMIDGETQFRKRAIQKSQQDIIDFAAAKHMEVSLALLAFTRLNWWSRWGWVIFGTNFLIWTASPAVKAVYTQRLAEQKARQDTGKAPEPMSQDNLRKAQSASERPQ